MVQMQLLPIHQLKIWAGQPRQHCAETGLLELSASIQQQGILQPILVRPGKEGWLIVAGERRWRAAQLAGLQEIPVLIRPMDDAEALIVALVENLQREDLNSMDRAYALKRLYEQLGSWEAVGKAVGFGEATGELQPLSERRMFQLHALTNLPEVVQQAILSGDLTEKHGRALGRIKDAQQQQSVLHVVQAHQLSGPETEFLLRLIREEANSDLEALAQQVRARKKSQSIEKIRVSAGDLTRLLSTAGSCTPAERDIVDQALKQVEAQIRAWRRVNGLKTALTALPPGL
jgi:ParB family chromosome partitioning protein